MVLESYEPKKLWKFFEEISQIPRCSKHEEKIIEYLKSYAQKKGLEWKQDETGNVFIYKPASKGMENKPTVILQSHIDMVREKNKGTEHDFSKDPIKLQVDGDWLTADGTTLGSDNGIGVAATLAILDDDELKTGKIEALFTVDEETGLTGAFGLNPDYLSGKIMLNIDSEEEGAIYIGCAGGRDTNYDVALTTEMPSGETEAVELKLLGLRGGHSGLNIHEGRGNAIKLLTRALYTLSKSVKFNIASFDAGDKHNAIPREATAVILINKDAVEFAKKLYSDFCEKLKKEFSIVEPKLAYEFNATSKPEVAFDSASTAEILDLLMIIPHGVLTMSSAVEGLVETSTNLAVVKTDETSMKVLMSHRSSTASAIDWVADIHKAIAETAGIDIEQGNGYPGWTPNPDSELLTLAKKAFAKVLGKEPEVKAIHAGLECGIIGEKCGGLDTISFGPTIEGAHSPDERVGIKSTEIVWNCMLELLKEIYN
jgi:dipeptidase D